MRCGLSSRPSPRAGIPSSWRRAAEGERGRPDSLASALRRRRGLAHHREHVVVGDGLTLLVGDRRVPAHLAVTGTGAQRLLLAGEAHTDAITGLHWLDEAQG